MKKYVISAVLAFLPFGGMAQDDSANVVRALLDPNSAKSEPLIQYLNNEKMTIYEYSGSHYFVPRPVPDWVSFQEDINAKCQGDDGRVVESVLEVLYYNPEILSELSAAAGVPVDKVFTVPHFARSVFLEYPDDVIVLDTSITAEALIQGGDLAATRTLPSFERYRVEDVCSNIVDFLVAPKLTVSFHALGTEFVRSSIYADVVFKTDFNTFFDISNNESETETSTITVSSEGRGLTIDAGFITLDEGSGSQTTTTTVNKFRVVNRNWLSRRATTTVSSLNVEEICEGQPANCGASAFRDTLLQYVFRESESSTALLLQQAGSNYRTVVGNAVQPVSTMDVDENVKAFLNYVYDRSSETETEFSYGGITAKVKKDSSGKLTIDGNVEWQRNGTDWIPTSFSVLLVDLESLEASVDAQYTQILRGTLSKVSFVSDQVNSQFPAGFISSDVLSRYIELEEINRTIIPRITSLEEVNPLQDQSIAAIDRRLNGIYLQATSASGTNCQLNARLTLGMGTITSNIDTCLAGHRAISAARYVYGLGGSCLALQVCSTDGAPH